MFHLTQRFAKLIPLMAFGPLCGCTEEPVYEKLFTTDHFDYYIEQGAEPPCEETGEWLERYYDANSQFMGVELPSGGKIAYHLIDKRDTLIFECSSANGCTKDGEIFINASVHAHEIVHAVGFLLNEPPHFLAEGLATALGCEAPGEGQIDSTLPIEDLLEAQTWLDFRETNGSNLYWTAASFVRYLIDKFGSARFLAYYARVPKDASGADIADHFQKEFGVLLDDALVDWRNQPEMSADDVCLRLMECDPSGLPQLGDDIATLGCGPWAESTGESLSRFRVENERTPHIVMTPLASESQNIPRASFFRCPTGSVFGLSQMVARYQRNENGTLSVDPKWPQRRFILDVPQGDYFAWLTSTEQTQIEVEMTESLSPARNGCLPAPAPLVLNSYDDTVFATRWMDKTCSGFWCPGYSWDVEVGPTGGTISFVANVVNGEIPFAPATVYLCSEPCPADANQCEVVTLDPGTRSQSQQQFAPGTIVHIGAPLAQVKEYFTLGLRLIPPCNGNSPCVDPWHGPR